MGALTWLAATGQSAIRAEKCEFGILNFKEKIPDSTTPKRHFFA
jgi:hypothetical protein